MTAGGNYTVELVVPVGVSRSNVRSIGGSQQSVDGEWMGDGASSTQGGLECRLLSQDLQGARLHVRQPGRVEFVYDGVDPPCALNVLLPCEVWLETPEPLEVPVGVVVQVSEGTTYSQSGKRQDTLDATGGALLPIPQWCNHISGLVSSFAGSSITFHDAAGVLIATAEQGELSLPRPPLARFIQQTGATPVTILFQVGR